LYAADAERHAHRFGPACPQLDLQQGFLGSEDCLTLNLWIPEGASRALPALVFLHGGGNVSDTASNPRYDGARLAQRANLIVVSVEFRLGALGYLAHPALAQENTQGVSGNYGFWDQLTALAWLNQNLPTFGGDGRMTLMGQSAGARNLCALITTPLGLLSGVDGAILQSGACTAITRTASEAQGHHVALALGCGIDADPAACLRNASAEAVTLALPSLPDPMTTSTYNVTIDGWAIPEPPLDALRTGRARQLRLLVGTNPDEVAHVVPHSDLNSDYPNLVQSYFGADLTEAVVDSYPLGDYASPTAALAAAITDARYTCSARRSLRAAVDGGGSSVYRYAFAHRPEHPPYAAPGAVHGIELMYLFQNFEAYGYDPGPSDRALAREMAAYIADFAHHGTLAPADFPVWPAYSREAPAFHTFGTPETPDRSVSHCDFWDALEPD
jgi:para-nitrobenzyl esterase